jgi:hypothetical protein
MRVCCNKDYSWDRISVRVAEENQNGTLAHMQPATFVDLARGAFATESFHLDERGAQEMMNELWRLGVRPTDGSGSTGHLGALENHLADLRKIIFRERTT